MKLKKNQEKFEREIENGTRLYRRLSAGKVSPAAYVAFDKVTDKLYGYYLMDEKGKFKSCTINEVIKIEKREVSRGVETIR